MYAQPVRSIGRQVIYVLYGAGKLNRYLGNVGATLDTGANDKSGRGARSRRKEQQQETGSQLVAAFAHPVVTGPSSNR